MFSSGQKIGVAVSGGADSVCLLYVLRELAPRWGLRLSVLHLDHGLRGEESRGDAQFVREMAGALGLSVCVRATNLADAAGNLEQAAREARLAFFREQIASRAVDRVALGHTSTDQAETVLYRLLRGSGTAGLSGIRPVTADGIVRPLLDMSRADVVQFLQDRGIRWREDSTNCSPRFARNRIRHELLPRLERDWNPKIAETLAHMADCADAEEAYWKAVLDDLAVVHLTEREGAVLVRTGVLEGLPLAAARRLVRHAMERVRGDLRGIGFLHVEAVLEAAGAGKGHARVLVPGLEILRSFDWLRFARPGPDHSEYRFRVSVPGTSQPPGAGISISLELVEKSGATGVRAGDVQVYNELMGVDWERLSGPLEIRGWRAGDRYQPVGSTRAEKLKTLFHRSHIPLWERRNWPILIDGSSIVWALQFGPAVEFAAGPASRKVLTIAVADAL